MNVYSITTIDPDGYCIPTDSVFARYHIRETTAERAMEAVKPLFNWEMEQINSVEFVCRIDNDDPHELPAFEDVKNDCPNCGETMVGKRCPVCAHDERGAQ